MKETVETLDIIHDYEKTCSLLKTGNLEELNQHMSGMVLKYSIERVAQNI